MSIISLIITCFKQFVEEKEKAQRSFFLPEEPMDAAPATPVTDDEEPIPPTPPVINVKGKAKIWKTVQKTYEDEEGFFGK